MRAHIDAVTGVTGESLLGALVDAGASIEEVEHAVRTLGVGRVRLAWARVPRRDMSACAVRVRAPEQTPDLPTWDRIQQVLTYAALADPVRDHALEAVRRLVTAEADVAGVEVDDLQVSPVGALDMLANVVGVCAAIHELGLTDITIGPVGVGTGTADTFAGPVEVPTAAVRRLLEGYELAPQPVAAELTSATGAALVATFTHGGTAPPHDPAGRTGLGAGDRSALPDAVVRVQLAA